MTGDLQGSGVAGSRSAGSLVAVVETVEAASRAAHVLQSRSWCLARISNTVARDGRAIAVAIVEGAEALAGGTAVSIRPIGLLEPDPASGAAARIVAVRDIPQTDHLRRLEDVTGRDGLEHAVADLLRVGNDMDVDGTGRFAFAVKDVEAARAVIDEGFAEYAARGTMLMHRYPIGEGAPRVLRMLVEIPRSPAMSEKLEVNPHDGTVYKAGDICPPIATYWHYGCIPETVGDEGEPLDAVLVGDRASRGIGEQVEVRVVGVFRTIDGWETKDDKIIVVPNTREFAAIGEIDDLPPIETSPGARQHLAPLMEAFLAAYRSDGEFVYEGWGSRRDALQIIENGMAKYRTVPLAEDMASVHTYPLYRHIFIPPPLKVYGPTFFVEDVVEIDRLTTGPARDREYGQIVSGTALKSALRDAGHAIGRSRLQGHVRARLIGERLDMAELLIRYGCKVFTASNDAQWLDAAAQRGVIATYVDQEEYAVENVAGISALDLWTVQFQRADGTHVVIVEHGVDRDALRDRLMKIGIAGPEEDFRVLNVPDRIIPWEVPARGGRRFTQLSNWIDYGFNIWPDRRNRPHLVVGEAVQRIARVQGREDELDAFLRTCRREFFGVHVLRLAEGKPYGAPTNSIDLGTAIISNDSLCETSRREMEAVLQRPIDNSLRIEENAPGLRCAVIPIDKSTYSILLEGDPLHHASVDRSRVDPLDPMDPFFDVHGPEHESLAARIRERREAIGELSAPQNSVTARRRRAPE